MKGEMDSREFHGELTLPETPTELPRRKLEKMDVPHRENGESYRLRQLMPGEVAKFLLEGLEQNQRRAVGETKMDMDGTMRDYADLLDSAQEAVAEAVEGYFEVFDPRAYGELPDDPEEAASRIADGITIDLTRVEREHPHEDYVHAKMVYQPWNSGGEENYLE